ncbi:MAG: pyridoxine 5'-phosphate synthase [Desulfobacterales bacterium CG23_combo_of_CG06-09_8_20_14_all_51_8]|nr:MAG: pyridoxine 5'-phosphate synthase [Desulfobacterales bacterium CG23_combo_of_CG06-09_8_20_14_all_51_8]
MAGLAVNVDHIATLRQARGNTPYPDPVPAAVLAELAGADGIVAHLREDRRHIQDRDVYLLRKTVATKLILEMAATHEMIKIATDVKPDLVTLVPEKRQELTTEGGLDVITLGPSLKKTITALHGQNIPVSLFVDPDPAQIEAARKMDADMIEIHTGAFCDAVGQLAKDTAFAAVIEAAKCAARLNLGVNAGHGLCYHSIKRFKGLKEIDEFSIGHSIISRAALVGMDRAVRDMLALIKEL